MNRALVSRFNRTLLLWGKRNYREMPWRDTRDAYRILISEVMLQQTQVSRVMKKYPAFLRRFPTMKKLAAAQLRAVLSEWSGLGYNRRAKYLHELAKKVATERKGKFPNELSQLLDLPGVGLSTAGALLAFAWDKDVPMIDTNIRRILARVFFREKKLPSDKELHEFAVSIIPKGKGRTWNYAMLDLGATLCTARGHSDVCPLMSLHGKVGDFRYKKPQPRFAGSNRYYRGKVLRYLAHEGRATIATLKMTIAEAKEPKAIIMKLEKEGLIEKRGRSFALPGRG